MDASDWELYSLMDGAEEVAQKLNQKFQKLIAEGKNRGEVFREMDSLMDEYVKFGACDSEPSYKLELLLNQVFGEAEER